MNALYTPTSTTIRRVSRRHRRFGLQEFGVTDAVNIEQFLRGRGFASADAMRRGREELERAGLTHPGKQAFVASKLDAAEQLLAATFLRACGDACVKIDRTGAGRAREVMLVPAVSCEICGGSNNRRAAIACVRLLRRKSIARLVVVGGSPNQQAEMKELLGGTGLEVRFVDGTRGHSAKDALANRRWAQLIVVWGPTPLRHAVSDLYTDEPLPHLRIVTVSRRGIEALCQAVTRSFT